MSPVAGQVECQQIVLIHKCDDPRTVAVGVGMSTGCAVLVGMAAMAAVGVAGIVISLVQDEITIDNDRAKANKILDCDLMKFSLSGLELLLS